MRALILLTISSSLAAGIGYWTTQAVVLQGDRSAAPRAVLDFTHKDFGTVQQGDLLVAEFPITNIGNRRLVVNQHTTSCCQESTSTLHTVIYPNETKMLRSEIDSGRWSGKLLNRDRITTNDPKMPAFEITTTAVVR